MFESRIWFWVMVSIVAIVSLSGCSQEQVKPTVTVDDINIKDASLQNLELEIRVIVSNPNPVSITLQKISSDIYYLENSQPKYLGHGEKHNIEIRKKGDTTVTIPVTVDNLRLVGSVLELVREGSIVLKVSGSAYLNLGGATLEIPFEKMKTLTFSYSIPKTTTTVTTLTETATTTTTTIVQSTGHITTTTTIWKLKTLIITAAPNPAKVREKVTIKVVDEDGNPVEGAWVGYIDVAKAIFTKNVITNLNLIGKTDSNGIVEHKFTTPGLYYIGAKKIGYKFGYDRLRIKIFN